MMRIAIVDDDSQERENLVRRLSAQLTQRALEASLWEYEGGEAFLEAARSQPFQLIFLDIYMGALNGMETARQLREFDTECMLVFTTSSTDHALDGFRVRAMHYLVKPYTEKELSNLMDEITKRLPAAERYLEIKSDGKLLRLRYREIQYAENFQHRVYIHTTDGREFSVRQTFSQFFTGLEDPRFFLCSRGVLINLESALDFDGKAFLLQNGQHIPVNRDQVKTAQRVFADFLFQKGGS